MRLSSELRVLYQLLLAPRRGATAGERLESFYAGQAEDYDGFRERLLPGRRELVRSLPFDDFAGGVWVDLGAGTGANVEMADPAFRELKRVYLVDLCPSLLAVARRRKERLGWETVTIAEADAASFVPPEGKADIVTLSYSLTMMGEWAAVLEHAERLLNPGGVIAVVDFYIGAKYPPEGWARHGWATRSLWPLWFAFDDVFLSPEPPLMLHRHFAALEFAEARTRLPYLPLATVPYYRFVGRKN